MNAFSVEGTIDGEAVHASYADGVLVADQPLVDRAEIVVALGDHFEDGDVRLAASLRGSPEAVLLTLIRACDAPTAVHIEPILRHRL